MTSPREAIMRILGRTPDHLSADQIYSRVKKISPNCGLMTVYRTLDLLTTLGIVLRFDYGEGKSRFELSDAHSKKPHHHHLICRICHAIVDFSDFSGSERRYMKRVTRKLESKQNFSIEGHEINFRGLCSACKRRTK